MSRETPTQQNQRRDMQLVRQATLAVVNRNAKRQNERDRFSSAPPDDADDGDSILPVFDKFAAFDSIHSMTNFSQAEFESLWFAIKPSVLRTWNVGKGRKCPYFGKDILFMLLTVVKSGGTWEFLAALFGLQAPSFEKMVTKFLLKIHDQVYEIFVQDEAKLQQQTHNESMFAFSGKHKLYGKKVEVTVSS
ncbi:hypothetical protein H310_10052 [Aphanomyces invadans]|uniref:DDE Tnp4 domain-containing protein n=1 Tax=Aphanomyces invadans TaxID=157072 RepID=A0A024TRF2_9STRA|nr:hypothetical protein H310_10052 [Aphanomyces invadans]ETV96735.1 hypothetical protein H310_10052 [Aphanomyces invadans]|eukprot:XP_008874512.1 hypothetical protein H310_10052 [Aphanomyces invadans]